jgi:cell division GTPase FtsZ
MEVISNSVAVNTDVTDLSGLHHIKADYKHRILIGNRRTSGHGVGKINEIGAELAREDGDKVIETIRSTPNLAETDAFMLVASAAGGTGSGSIPVLTRMLKERHTDKPVYNLIVLPFNYEIMTEERSIYNVGTCLKSAYLAADAIFLVDNQRYVRKSSSMRENMAKINYQVVKPFFNLLCAGEETTAKYVGSRVMDAGDIIQTLSGWSVIGYGKAPISRVKMPFREKLNFRDRGSETQKGVQAMEEALNELSLRCNPNEARRALYLLSAPHQDMNMDLVKEISDSLKSMATEAVIRSGDYPRAKGELDITVVLSELVGSRKIMDYFTKTINYISNANRRRGGIEYGYRGIEDAFRDIPSLL